MPGVQIFERGPTRSSMISQQLSQALGSGLEGYQQGQQAIKQKSQQGQLAKALFPDDTEKQKLFSSLPAEQQIAAHKTLQPKVPKGGPTAQATPPEIANKMSKILRENPNANAEELALLSDEAGVPRIFSNSLIESRRQIQSDTSNKNVKERDFQTKQAKDVREKVSDLKSTLPRKKMALRMSSDAINSGEIGIFSINNLADRLNIPELRTAKGAQLVTAGKENLLGNMSRVSARGQNQWFEQRLNSMFPQIGQSEAANETVQAMIEGEVKLDDVYVKAYNELVDEDRKKHNYVQGDTLEDRIYKKIEPKENEIMKEVGFKTRNIYEKEKGINWLKEHINDPVPHGTLLTPRMANLFKDKFGGDKNAARQFAEKLGYEIAKPEEIISWTL